MTWTKPRPAPRRRRGARAVYASKRWQLVRLRVFERDGWRCVLCGRAGRLECDHDPPLHALPAAADPCDPAGLRTLCRACHVEVTARQNGRRFPPEARAAAKRSRAAWDALVDAV